MALLRNVKTQEFENVPDSQAAGALIGGSHDITEGQIEVQSPTSGEIFSIPTNEAAKHYQLGYTTPNRAAVSSSEDQAQQEQYNEHFDTPAIAATAGALRGASLGTSDAIMGTIGDITGTDLRGALKTTKEVNPISSTVGEVGGAIAGSLVTGGFGTSGIARGIAEAGNVAKGIGIAESTSNLLKVADIAGSALGGVAEGGLMGAGIGLSDAVLNKSEDVAEKMFMNAMDGAKFGGFIGAGGGAFGAYGAPILASVATKGKELADIAGANILKMFGKVGSKFVKDPEAAQAFETVMSNPEWIKAASTVPSKELEANMAKTVKQMDEHLDEIKNTSKQVQEDVKQFANNEKQTWVDAVELAKGDIPIAYDSLRAQKNMLYDVAKDASASMSGQPSQHIGNILDSFTTQIKKLESSGLSAEKDLAKDMYMNLRYAIGPENDNLLALKGMSLKKAASQALDGEQEMAAIKMLDEYTGKLAYSPMQKTLVGQNKPIAAQLQKEIASVYDIMPNRDVGNAFKDAHSFNQVYNKVGKTLFKDGDLKTTLANPRSLDSLNTIMDQIGDAAPQLKELAQMANNTKKADALYGTWTRLNKNDKLDPNVLTDFIQQSGGDLSKIKDFSKLAALQKEFVANPQMTGIDKLVRYKGALGQPIDDTLKYAAANQVRSGVVKSIMDGSHTPGFGIGDFIALSLLGPKGAAIYKGAKTLAYDPYTALQGASKILNTFDSMSQKVAKAGNAIVDLTINPKAQSAIISTNRSVLPEDIKKAKETITLLSDPKTFQEVMGQKTAGIASQPQVSSAVNLQTAKVTQFLQGKLPVAPEVPIGGKATEPSNYETAKFARYLNAVEDPLGAVHRMAVGRGTPEEVETLQTVYPSTFKDLQGAIMNGIVDRGAELPYSKRIALSQMFGLQLDSTLQGDFVQKMQAQLQPGGDNGGEGRPQGSTDKAPRFKRRLDESVASDLQKLTNGEYKS